MRIHIVHHVELESPALENIACLLEKLVKGGDDKAVIEKATKDLDQTGKELQTAIDKNKIT